jgi:long-chain acyl-CoA synthetase
LNNLAEMVPAAATAAGERVALRLDDRTVSFAELDRASAAVAADLTNRGVGPGDRVGLILPNVHEFPICYFGALRAGAVAVPMNVQLKAREVAHCVGDSGAKVVFAWSEVAHVAVQGARGVGAEPVVVAEGSIAFGPTVEPASPAACAPEDTAMILYTSGTTGSPKGAELTHANLAGNARTFCELFGLGETDVVFGGLPLFHSFGQTCAMNAALLARAELTLLPRFDSSRALEVLERDRVTVFEGVPTMYGALLADPDAKVRDTGALRLCISGGASLPGELMQDFEREFGCPILEGYGLSETSPVASFNRSAARRKVGSVGLPITGVEMRVVDREDRDVEVGEIGEILIRGANVMKGYWRRPEETRMALRSGWFHTGDLGRVDEDGFFYIVDREKDMIIRGGYNVYPREIEELLYEHPAVAEAAVFGVADERLGEEVAAVVSLREGFPAKAEELREYARSNLAAYKYPRSVHILPSLPKGPTGKILKRRLRALADNEWSET